MKLSTPLTRLGSACTLSLALIAACGSSDADENSTPGAQDPGKEMDPENGGGAGPDGTGASGGTAANGSSTGGTTANGTGGSPGHEARPQPNILVIIADDFGLDKASLNANSPCYDSGDTADDPPMPNLAELCNEGVRFENAWATPTCSPTRARIMTGRLPYAHGVGGPLDNANALALNTVTLPRRMAEAGYATAAMGKWHLSRGVTDPNTLGWDHYSGSLTGGLPSYADWTKVVDGESVTETGYATSVTVDDAVSWLEQQTTEQPWLLWLAFNAPHTPFHKPPDELHDYDYLDPTLSGDPEPYYAAMSQAMDTEIGRLLAYLNTRQMSDDTLIVFVGDNGTPAQVASAPVTGPHAKASLYEGGLRVPFIVTGPGVPAGTNVNTPVSVTDLFISLQVAAGLEAPNTPDSLDLWPLISGNSSSHTAPVISELFGLQVPGDKSGKAIRDATHKLICFEDGHQELYNLTVDPWETQELLVGGSAPAGVFEALAEALESKTGSSICSL